MFRPFPERELAQQLRRIERLAVLDRDISLGMGGVLGSEARGSTAPGCLVQNYVLGLGGGDIRPDHVSWVIEDLRARAASGRPELVEVA